MEKSKGFLEAEAIVNFQLSLSNRKPIFVLEHGQHLHIKRVSCNVACLNRTWFTD